jgi:hypothetical protein
MDHARLEVGALLGRTWTSIASAPAEVGAYILAMSAFGSFIDIYFDESAGGYFVVTVASFIAGYFLLRAMLGKCGLLSEQGVGGLGAYFGTSIVGGLGMVFALIVFIIPGIVLMTRWSAAFALLVAEDKGVDALGDSWDLTAGNFWPIFAATLVGIVPLLVLVIALGASVAFSESGTGEATVTWAELIAGNLLGNLYGVFSTALGIAVYWMLRGERRDVAEVFA